MLPTSKSYAYFMSKYQLSKTGEWHNFDCPFCDGGKGSKNAHVHFGYRVVKCWKCGYRERVDTFVMDTHHITAAEAWQVIRDTPDTFITADIVAALEGTVKRPVTHSNVQLPHGYKPILSGSGIFADRARAYLIGRGYDLTQLDRQGVGYCDEVGPDGEDYFGYIILPVKYRDQLEYFIARSFTGVEPKYKNPSKERMGFGKDEIIFNRDALELRNFAYVLEGIFDALCLGKYATATNGWSMSERQHSLYLQSNCKLLVFVPDVGFYREALRTAARFLGHKRVKVLNTDTLEHLGKDVNEIGAEHFAPLVKQTPDLTLSMYIALK